MSDIDFSLMQNAASDAASLMPGIAGKKILMGFWHNWPAGLSDGYRQGRFASIALEDVPREYNVVAVAFMKGSGIPTFKPFNVSDAEFRRQVGVLNSEGRAVLISLGGADAHIELLAVRSNRWPMKLSAWWKLMALTGWTSILNRARLISPPTRPSCRPH